MLVSNPGPLPCESEACSFATVRRYPFSAFRSQIGGCRRRGRLPSFAPVVVKLSSRTLPLVPIRPGAQKASSANFGLGGSEKLAAPSNREDAPDGDTSGYAPYHTRGAGNAARVR
jgi:hypothetical protein